MPHLPGSRPLPNKELRARAVVAEVSGPTGGPGSVGWHTWRRDLVILAAVVGVATATGAAVYSTSAKPTISGTVRCYSTPSTADGDDFPGTSVGLASDPNTVSGPQRELDALSACSNIWRQGFLVLGRRDLNIEPTGQSPVPELAACVIDGYPAVVPGDPDTTCRALSVPKLAEEN